jgi:hypothetical protein
MVSVDYSDVHNAMNLSTGDITIVQTENLIDHVIDTMNLFGDLSIANMSGAAGSKTVTLTQRERACMLLIARVFYYSFYQSIEGAQVGEVAIGAADLMSNPQTMRTVRSAIRVLRTHSFLRG